MKRKLIDFLFVVATGFCALLALVILGSVVHFILSQGSLYLYHQLFSPHTASISLDRQRLIAMGVSTSMIVGTTLLIIFPFALATSIYLNEYAKDNWFVSVMRFCIGTLSGIPSIVYGLFGMMVFVRMLHLGMSIIAGSLTLSLMLFPLLMKQIEQALKQVPMLYREASIALGTTSLETVKNVVIPTARPGIMVGLLLVIGRIIGESAALLFTVGSFVRLPVGDTGILSIFEAGTTLTIRAFIEVKEYGHVEVAAAIGIVIMVLVLMLNISTKLMVWLFSGD